MAGNYLKIVRVFLGSPGGLEDERNAAKRIVDEINQSHAEHWGCEIKLIGWEATLPGYSRAQSLINADLDKCDYFVGVLWNHWGSKPDDGGSLYSSGFEEEYFRATARHEDGLIKDIALFFREISEVQLNDLGPSVAKVVQFRAECVAKRRPLFKDFRDVQDFHTLFRAKIEEIGWKEAPVAEQPDQDPAEPGGPTEAEEQRALVPNATSRLIGEASAAFVADLLTRSSEWEATGAHEVARLRLIATAISRSGNDESYLGNHDANLLFANRAVLAFSAQEVRALIDTGVVGFQQQNVPLWSWIAEARSEGIGRLNILAAFGNSQERAPAIRLLQALELRIPRFGENVTEELVLRNWLLSDTHSGSSEAALDFLQANGSAEEIAVAEALLPDLPPATRDKLATAIVAATLRIGVRSAFQKLVALDLESPGEDLAWALFKAPESVSTDQLRSCLALRSDEIRRRAVELMTQRDALSPKDAEALFADKDYGVRLAAVRSLLKQGRAMENDLVRRLLTKKGVSRALGIHSGPDSDESYYLQFQSERLSALSFDQLKAAADASGVFDYLELTTLYRVYTKKVLSEIHRNLEDGFEGHFERLMAEMSLQYGSEHKLITDTRGLLDFLRKRLVQASVEAICRLDGAQLPIVRRTLDRFELNFSDAVLNFLGKHGDWSDRNRVLAFERRYAPGRTMLTIGGGRNELKVANALVKVAGRRLADLLAMEAGSTVRSAVVRELSNRDIKQLSDEILLTQLNDKNQGFRRVMALRCSVALPQSRIKRLLEKYVNRDGQKYYNSIHWLDLGASMSRAVATKVGKNQLA